MTSAISLRKSTTRFAERSGLSAPSGVCMSDLAFYMTLSHFLYVAGDSDFNLASASVQMDAELFQRALIAYEDEFPKKTPAQNNSDSKSDKGSDKARHVCFIFKMASALA